MDNFTMILMLVIICLLCTLLILFWQNKTKSDMEVQRIDALERRLAETMYDLRGEQNSLARAARMENQAANDRLSEQIDKRVARLADMTDNNLERIRMTVDERLNESLEVKFEQVSKRLAEVHQSLGKMQSLSGGVDELRRILSNVKVRGTWGEMQLGNILQDILDKARYVENAEIRPHSGLRVEYALRLPGQNEHEVLLPIDAKFPLEDYQRLQQAREAGDLQAAESALKQLERRLKSEAKDICEKYICPPYSTDFAVMYLPSEGLFVEVLNIPGLAEELQLQYRVCIAGPTTLAALVNSLLLGFRTLAVQQRTTEVWQLLNKVKHELAGLESALDKTARKLEEGQNSLHTTNRYVMKLTKQLNAVEVLDGDLVYGEQRQTKSV